MSNWLEFAKQATTREARIFSLVAWTPEHYLASIGNPKFSKAFSQSSPDLREFIRNAHRQIYRKRTSELPDYAIQDAKDRWLETLSGDQIIDILKLSEIDFVFGNDLTFIVPFSSPNGLQGVRLGNWLLQSASDKSIQFSEEQFLILCHAFIYHFRLRWLDPTADKMERFALGAENPFSKWITTTVEQISSAKQNEWLLAISDILENIFIANKHEYTESWTYTLGDIAENQKNIVSLIGEQNIFSKALSVYEKKYSEQQFLEKKQEEEWERERNTKHESEWFNFNSIFLKNKHLFTMLGRNNILLDISTRPVEKQQSNLSSYFGGLPELPEEISWPEFSNAQSSGSLRFVAQIDLKELPKTFGNPLPSNGKLLFFIDPNVFDSFLPCRVIFLADKQSTKQATPPTNFHVNRHGYFERKWLKPDDEYQYIEFKYPVQFAKSRSYIDTEDGSGTFGWIINSLFEETFNALDEKAIKSSLRVLRDKQKSQISMREPAEPDKKRKISASSFSEESGPYTWADVKLFIQCAERNILEHKLKAKNTTSKLVYHNPEILGSGVPEIIDQCKSCLAEWKILSNGKDDWLKLTENENLEFNKSIQRIYRWMRVGSKRDKRLVWLQYKEHLKSPDRVEDPVGYRPYDIPMASYELVGSDEKNIIHYNIRRACHEGLDPSNLYPLSLVDEIAPDVTVDNLTPLIEKGTRPNSFFMGGEKGHRMLGYGRSVQSAPTEFRNHVLLLQVFGGQLGWLDNSGCVVQFWIRRSDLLLRKWNKAFATLECD